MLLPALPRQHRYRVLFMQRPAKEIARSQAKMLARRGGSSGGPDADEAVMAARLHAHREEILRLLRAQPEVFELLEIDYPSLVADPGSGTSRVAEFLGPKLLPHPERMAGVVRRDLHRNKVAPGNT